MSKVDQMVARCRAEGRGALMPFVVLPFAGVMSAKETASAY